MKSSPLLLSYLDVRLGVLIDWSGMQSVPVSETTRIMLRQAVSSPSLNTKLRLLKEVLKPRSGSPPFIEEMVRVLLKELEIESRPHLINAIDWCAVSLGGHRLQSNSTSRVWTGFKSKIEALKVKKVLGGDWVYINFKPQ